MVNTNKHLDFQFEPLDATTAFSKEQFLKKMSRQQPCHKAHGAHPRGGKHLHRKIAVGPLSGDDTVEKLLKNVENSFSDDPLKAEALSSHISKYKEIEQEIQNFNTNIESKSYEILPQEQLKHVNSGKIVAMQTLEPV